jgi:hypothetical protein
MIHANQVARKHWTRASAACCAALVAALAGCRVGPLPDQGPVEQYVVFVEADYPLGSAAQAGACYQWKHQEASQALGTLVDSLFARSVAALNAGRRPAVEFYALNQNVTRLGTSESWRLDGLRSDYDVERASRRFREELLDSYESLLRARTGTDLNDVMNSIDFIRSKRDAWFAADTGAVVRVIYLNDLVHYNTNQSTDAASGQFNFSESYSFRVFQHNVEQGYLWDPRSTRLVDLAGETGFEVFSIPLPRCVDEPWPGGDPPNFDQLYPPVNQVWHKVFSGLGADEVLLGLTSPNSLFSRIPSGE